MDKNFVFKIKMRGRFTIYFLVGLVLITADSCKQSYVPPAIAANGSYLIVEGVINTGTDSTIFKLSNTVNLSGKTSSNPELNAQVIIEGAQNTATLVSYPLQEAGNGKYFLGPTNLDNTMQYRIRIKTVGGKEYLSDLVIVKNTPPIDSIGYTLQNDGVHIYNNTHDPKNNTRYYRWDFLETWQFHAKYQSLFITNGTNIVLRKSDKMNYSCFSNDASSTIILGSTAKLAQDVIFQNPITVLPASSEKIETKYSILLRQYALTKDAFNFWQNLKKNTEQLGSIFDAQPSQINGNIHCITNPAEPVIGYISATNAQSKRIFISNETLPLTYKTAYPYTCELDSFLFCRGLNCQNDVALFLIPLGSGLIPTSAIPAKVGSGIIGYFGTSVECSDCTIRGVVKPPDFWK